MSELKMNTHLIIPNTQVDQLLKTGKDHENNNKKLQELQEHFRAEAIYEL